MLREFRQIEKKHHDVVTKVKKKVKQRIRFPTGVPSMSAERWWCWCCGAVSP